MYTYIHTCVCCVCVCCVGMLRVCVCVCCVSVWIFRCVGDGQAGWKIASSATDKPSVKGHILNCRAKWHTNNQHPFGKNGIFHINPLLYIAGIEPSTTLINYTNIMLLSMSIHSTLVKQCDLFIIIQYSTLLSYNGGIGVNMAYSTTWACTDGARVWPSIEFIGGRQQ